MKKFILIVIFLFIIASGAYIFLGGLKKPSIVKMEIPSYLLVGKEYKGMAKDSELGDIFNQIHQLHQSKQLPGVLSTVYYQIEKSKNQDTTNVFVGVIVSDSIPKLPDGCIYRYFPKGTGLKATLFSNPLVSPRPESVQTEMIQFAGKQGLQLQKYVLEKYPDGKNFEMEILLKQ